jgi:large subunit ribosomal protein L18
MKKTATMRAARIRRHTRVRKRVNGTQERPRLSVYRSLSHIYAQVIDDVGRITLASASDVESDVTKNTSGKKKEEIATIVGGLLAERAKAKGLKKVVFDRGGYPFHGRIKALAEAARENGLEF